MASKYSQDVINALGIIKQYCEVSECSELGCMFHMRTPINGSYCKLVTVDNPIYYPVEINYTYKLKEE